MNKPLVFILSLMALTACNKPQTTGIQLEKISTRQLWHKTIFTNTLVAVG